ncbi:MAG: DUF3040 domain-containing protein [Aeromicrobium sp.]|uniref:DUF3040 domain-containing protein n=1 Tax=Aeromicrobium sp. TaxID=1871063 RepID=UPI0039E48CB5
MTTVVQEIIVPLSDEEARLLQQLEQSLAAEDPDFASTLRGSAFEERNRRLAALSAVGFLAGLGVLFFGTMATYTWLAVLGFVVMVGSGHVFVTAWRRGFGSEVEEPVTDISSGPRRSRRERGGSSTSFVERMEQRWQRRRDDDGRF